MLPATSWAIVTEALEINKIALTYNGYFVEIVASWHTSPENHSETSSICNQHHDKRQRDGTASINLRLKFIKTIEQLFGIVRRVVLHNFWRIAVVDLHDELGELTPHCFIKFL